MELKQFNLYIPISCIDKFPISSKRFRQAFNRQLIGPYYSWASQIPISLRGLLLMKNAKQKAETRKRVKPKEDSLTLAPGLKNEIDLTPKNFSFAQEIPLLRTLMQCLEERDPYSHGHSIRVAEYASILGVAIGLGKTSP